MSILIKGMKMPKAGDWKTIRIYYDGTCAVPNWQGDCKYMQGCEAVPVPPHGRLIDADAFIESERRLYCADCERRKDIRDGEVRIVHDIGDAPCLNCWIYDTLCDVEAFPAAEL